MDHQDWTTVVLKKKSDKKINQNNQNNQSNQNNFKKQDNDDKIQIKKVSKQMARQIIDGRVAKKMTQLNLAQQSCIDIKMIKEIENTSCVYNSDHINKISKVLGIKIDRKLNIINKEI
jgi:putative transcription factor